MLRSKNAFIRKCHQQPDRQSSSQHCDRQNEFAASTIPSSSVMRSFPCTEFRHWLLSWLLFPALNFTFHMIGCSCSCTWRRFRSLTVLSSCEERQQCDQTLPSAVPILLPFPQLKTPSSVFTGSSKRHSSGNSGVSSTSDIQLAVTCFFATCSPRTPQWNRCNCSPKDQLTQPNSVTATTTAVNILLNNHSYTYFSFVSFLLVGLQFTGSITIEQSSPFDI